MQLEFLSSTSKTIFFPFIFLYSDVLPTQIYAHICEQSRYFDCDDDDDSDTYSNLSSVIETEEFSTRVDAAETLYYCNGDDEYCNYVDGTTCEDGEIE